MSYIAGWGVYDKNFLFRMLVVFFAGLACFAIILAWRAQVLLTSEPYPELTPRLSRATSVMTSVPGGIE